MPESPKPMSLSRPAGPVPSAAPAVRGPVWYYARNKQKLGPFFWEEFRNLAAAGELQPADMVWEQGAPRWQQASAVPNLFPPPPSSPVPVLAPTVPGVYGFDMQGEL